MNPTISYKGKLENGMKGKVIITSLLQIEVMMKIIRELGDKNTLMNENDLLLKYKISVMEKEILSQADKIKQLEKNQNNAQGDDRQKMEKYTKTSINKVTIKRMKFSFKMH